MSINLDEIERAVGRATDEPWSLRSCSSGGVILVRPSQSVQIIPAADAELIVELRHHALELIRLARIGQATEAEGKGEGA